MVFSSLTFMFIFLPIVLLVYYISPKQFKNLFILISGLVFYAWGEPVYVVIMIVSTLIDYTAGLLIDKFNNKKKVRLVCLLVSLVMNLGLLGVFKYSGFILQNIDSIFGTSLYDPAHALPLPIGISFFTFQSMSYTIDMYLGKVKVQKNPIAFAAFVTLFPQIVAGPIVRYDDIAAELDNRTIDIDCIYGGIVTFITGVGKKVLIANNVGMLWTSVKAISTGQLSVLTAWLGIIAFTLQIYFDFSGYSDMAIGLGKMMGFNFPQNFNYPYQSRSISEFWRRWHITLGSWFKSYVYFPLGGSRKGMKKTLMNLAVVWLLTGIWHGASWNFILWGVLYGVLIILEKLFLGKILEKIPAFFAHLYTMLLVIMGWVLFDTADIPTAFGYMGAMLGGNGMLWDNQGMYFLINYGIILLIALFGCTDLSKRFFDKARKKTPKLMNYSTPFAKFGVLVLSTAYLADATYNPFLYFNF
ncbi:MAG: MBOAT family protein [Ruminococcaceae bacterium]|nr:MBOAT family protein [Oscillospiraceae bacterium]